MRGDTTAAVERVAGWLRSDGAAYPCAGALVVALRGHLGLTQESFADDLGVPLGRVEALENGCVPIGALPRRVDEQLLSLSDLDLLAICDLEQQWRSGGPALG